MKAHNKVVSAHKDKRRSAQRKFSKQAGKAREANGDWIKWKRDYDSLDKKTQRASVQYRKLKAKYDSV